MKRPLWLRAYGAATRLVLPLVFGYFAWRGRREPAYRRHWRERLGYIVPEDDSPIWLHAASVGEVVLVVPLIEALIERHAERRIVLTTFTPTGRAEARRRLGDRVGLCYLPLDTPGAVRRFFQRLGPCAGILAETELWPNLVAAAERAGVPLALVNASLSARSAHNYQRWPVSLAMRFMLSRLDLIAAAGAVHAERFVAAGVPERVVKVTGNLKYDRPENNAARRAAGKLRQQWGTNQRRIWLAASTHAPEESRLLEVFARLRRDHPDLLWVLAPRHPQRFDEVQGLLEGSGWQCARRSRDQLVDMQTDIVLADTLGELDVFYALADVAFVGGSLAPDIGGHNVIESAAAGCVFVTGPDVAEWREAMAAMIETGGATIAADAPQIAEVTSAWLDNPTRRTGAGQALVDVAASHRSALQRTLSLLNETLCCCQ